MTTPTAELLDELAEQYLGIDTLTERGSDALDLHEVPVWELRAALAAAYSAGASGGSE